MYIYVYVCIYVFMYMCIHIYIYMSVFVYLHNVYIYIYVTYKWYSRIYVFTNVFCFVLVTLVLEVAKEEEQTKLETLEEHQNLIKERDVLVAKKKGYWLFFNLLLVEFMWWCKKQITYEQNNATEETTFYCFGDFFSTE